MMQQTYSQTAGDLAAADAGPVPTDLLDALNWGGDENIVDSGQVNDDGDLIIEYYFEPAEGRFRLFYPRLEWTDYEKSRVDAAFETYEAIINIEFVETSTAANAEFKLNKVDSLDSFLGIMFPPGELNSGTAGFDGVPGLNGWDVGDGAGNPTTGGLEQGGYGFITLIHEFGHGLGLAHPHDTGGGSTVLPGVNGNPQSDTGDFDLNQGVYTIMSYVDGWATNPSGALNPGITVEYGYQGTPMALDIALLQQKYGANMDYATGDDVYVLADDNEAGTFYSAIWDAGGTDEIRYEGARDAIIDLREASLLSEEGGGGWMSFADGTFGGYTIANGVVIENATGGDGDDALVGNAADNIFTGNGGGDTFIFFEEGGGFDVITDFEIGADIIDLFDLGKIRAEDVVVEFDGETVIATFGDQTLELTGIDRADLSTDDFILA